MITTINLTHIATNYPESVVLDETMIEKVNKVQRDHLPDEPMSWRAAVEGAILFGKLLDDTLGADWEDQFFFDNIDIKYKYTSLEQV
tara:strand:+ start:691 stop:951 length:261 start_codon:yes stop_codon:yes gene_type:complete